MVDYNNDVTISRPAIDINRVQILERRAYVIQALELYYKRMTSGIKNNSDEFRNKFRSLFWELQGLLKRRFKNEQYDYNLLREKVLNPNTNIKELIILWECVNSLLDDIHLTKIDLRYLPNTPRERAIKYNEEKENK